MLYENSEGQGFFLIMIHVPTDDLFLISNFFDIYAVAFVNRTPVPLLLHLFSYDIKFSCSTI